jgi:hypothetical protein
MKKQTKFPPVTLADLEIRYANIRKQNPNVERCSIVHCQNPRDSTPLSGNDTCCAYHRLLFDYWSSECTDDFEQFNHYLSNRRARRSAFTKWRNKHSKEDLDAIVLKLANEGINWEC